MRLALIAVGALLLAAFAVHLTAGDREYKALSPSGPGAPWRAWLLGRCTFHMVSADLLLGGLFALLTGLGALPFNGPLLLFIGLLQAGYLVGWLCTLLASKAAPRDFLRLGQWVIFLAAGLLIAAGATL